MRATSRMRGIGTALAGARRTAMGTEIAIATVGIRALLHGALVYDLLTQSTPHEWLDPPEAAARLHSGDEPTAMTWLSVDESAHLG